MHGTTHKQHACFFVVWTVCVCIDMYILTHTHCELIYFTMHDERCHTVKQHDSAFVQLMVVNFNLLSK